MTTLIIPLPKGPLLTPFALFFIPKKGRKKQKKKIFIDSDRELISRKFKQFLPINKR